MEVALNDGRKAELIHMGAERCKIRLENGRDIYYPKDMIKMPEKKDEEPEIKIKIIPAIDRLEEFINDYSRMDKVREFGGLRTSLTEDEQKLFSELWTEAVKEYEQKWGLIS